MANNLYNTFGNNITDDMFNQLSRNAMELKRTLNGNPQQIVQNLVNSGQISQRELNQVFPFAMQIGERMSKNGFNR